MAQIGLTNKDFSEIVKVAFTLFAVIDILGSVPVIIAIKKKMGDINALNPVDSLVIAVGHQEFRTLTPETLKSYCTTRHQPVAADLKSLYDRHAMTQAGFTVFRF